MARQGDQFQLRLVGDNIAPETVAASDLGEFLKLWEQTIKATAKATGVQLPMDKTEPVVSLVGVSDGSNKLLMHVAPTLLAAVATISTALSLNAHLSLPRRARSKLYAISQQADRLGYDIELTEEAGRFPSSKIKRGTIPKPAEQTVRGYTTIYGTCVLVGGINKTRTEIRTHDGKTHHILIDRALGQALGNRLWTKVGLEGEAEWDSETWEIIEFKANHLNEFNPGDSESAHQEISDLVGNDWDGVDVPDYLARHRDGEI